MLTHLSKLRLLLVSLVLLAMASSGAAMSRLGQIVVTVVDGKPCFGLESTVATHRGEPTLRSVSVRLEGGSEQSAVWVFRTPPTSPGAAFTPPTCLRYGEVAPDAIVSKEPTDLVSGKVYSVFIRARGMDATDPTLGYTAEFCLQRNPDQTLRVHQKRPDAKAGKWPHDFCTEQ